MWWCFRLQSWILGFILCPGTPCCLRIGGVSADTKLLAYAVCCKLYDPCLVYLTVEDKTRGVHTLFYIVYLCSPLVPFRFEVLAFKPLHGSRAELSAGDKRVCQGVLACRWFSRRFSGRERLCARVGTMDGEMRPPKDLFSVMCQTLFP